MKQQGASISTSELIPKQYTQTIPCSQNDYVYLFQVVHLNAVRRVLDKFSSPLFIFNFWTTHLNLETAPSHPSLTAGRSVQGFSNLCYCRLVVVLPGLVKVVVYCRVQKACYVGVVWSGYLCVVRLAYMQPGTRKKIIR